MFKLGKERKVWWPVRLAATNEAGESSTVTIRALITLLKADELLALRTAPLQKMLAGAGAATDPDALLAQLQADERALTDRVQAHVTDWRGVVDEDGADVSFSAEALAGALDYADVRQAFAVALREASTGAAAKN